MTDADLLRELEVAFQVGIRAFSRRPSSYRTSFPIDEVDVELEGGGRAELILKEVTRAALDRRLRRLKPEFLHDAAREGAAYRVLTRENLGTPRLVACGDGWLLLERIPGVELYQVGELARWQEAARWLSALHGRFARRTPDSPHLLRHDADFYRAWPRRAIEFGRRELEPIIAGYDTVVERLVSLPKTFIHGEFYPSNVLVGPGGRVAPVDWEMAAIGPGLIDLAALTTGWSAEEAVKIAAAYGPIEDEALECCRLHLAFQWLGWARDWVAPGVHARDWSEDAMLSAARLGLS